ncbi:MAG: cytidylate kinase-like family protein [Oscillospiraceae bacterium]|nr:cytidylate kinase-like family protein [Oscillospiraceae bacterium]
MKNYVVTLSREFGSLGRPIAKRLAELLGIECYDRDIVEKTAENLGMPVSVISNMEESAKKNLFVKMSYPLGTGTTEEQDTVFHEQVKIIRNLVEQQSCIIVGRCSDFILQNEKNCLHIFVYAPYEQRYRNCVDSLRMEPETAEKMIAKVDKARSAYHLHYAGYLPNDENHQDLMINSSLLGVNGTAECLAEIVQKCFPQTNSAL